MSVAVDAEVCCRPRTLLHARARRLRARRLRALRDPARRRRGPGGARAQPARAATAVPRRRSRSTIGRPRAHDGRLLARGERPHGATDDSGPHGRRRRCGRRPRTRCRPVRGAPRRHPLDRAWRSWVWWSTMGATRSRRPARSSTGGSPATASATRARPRRRARGLRRRRGPRARRAGQLRLVHLLERPRHGRGRRPGYDGGRRRDAGVRDARPHDGRQCGPGRSAGPRAAVPVGDAARGRGPGDRGRALAPGPGHVRGRGPERGSDVTRAPRRLRARGLHDRLAHLRADRGRRRSGRVPPARHRRRLG